MKLALLRHGPTEWNKSGLVQGQTDIALSAEGITKMRTLALPSTFADAHVYASPLLRARQTVEAMGLGEATLDARLMEQHWGTWEGLSLAQIRAREGEDAFIRAGLGENFRPRGGESTAELHARVDGFLKDLGLRGQDAVAITHLGVLRAAYTLATGWDMATPMPAGLDLSKILVLDLNAGAAPRLNALNLDFTPRTA